MKYKMKRITTYRAKCFGKMALNFYRQIVSVITRSIKAQNSQSQK